MKPLVDGLPAPQRVSTFAAVFRVFPDLLAALQALLPPWALPIVGVLLVLGLTPAYLYWSRSKQLKSRLRRYGLATTDAERQALAEETFALAAKSPRLVVFLGDEALRLGYKPLLDRSLAWLRESGAAPTDLARLSGKTTRDKPAPMHPVEEAVHVERMLGMGMLEAARERLSRALARFPEDPDLVSLEAQLREAEQGAPSADAG